MVAGNEDFDRGRFHVHSGPDPTSGRGVWALTHSARGPVEGAATEHMEMQVGH